MQKYIFGLLGVVTVASGAIAFAPIETRSKELFFGFAGTVATGSFTLMTPQTNARRD